MAKAAAGIRFYTAERKAEAASSTPEDFTEAQLAWLAYSTAGDAVRAHKGEPFGDDRKVELQDFLYHPAFQEWRDETENEDDVPDGTDEEEAAEEDDR